jgi:hypothetical protein
MTRRGYFDAMIKPELVVTSIKISVGAFCFIARSFSDCRSRADFEQMTRQPVVPTIIALITHYMQHLAVARAFCGLAVSKPLATQARL